MAQADKMRAKATKATAAQNMAKRAERLLSGLEAERQQRQGRQDRLPEAGPLRQDAADGRGAVQVVRLARGLHRRRPRDRSRVAGRHPRAQRRRQDHAAAHPRRVSTSPTPARCCPATGSSSGTTRRSTRPSTSAGPCWRTSSPRLPNLTETQARSVLGSFLFSGDDAQQAGPGALRRREDPARAGHAGRLGGERPAARRADQQPRPGQPRGGARRDPHATRARSCWSPTTRARWRRSTPTGCSSSPTASRTCGMTSTWS